MAEKVALFGPISYSIGDFDYNDRAGAAHTADVAAVHDSRGRDCVYINVANSEDDDEQFVELSFSPVDAVRVGLLLADFGSKILSCTDNKQRVTHVECAEARLSFGEAAEDEDESACQQNDAADAAAFALKATFERSGPGNGVMVALLNQQIEQLEAVKPAAGRQGLTDEIDRMIAHYRDQIQKFTSGM